MSIAALLDEVFNNGYADKRPNREVVREPYTREELEAKYDEHIIAQANHWGDDYIYTEWARESKAKNLQAYDEGKVVAVYTEEYHKDGMDWAKTYYSDGTVSTTNYGYSD